MRGPLHLASYTRQSGTPGGREADTNETVPSVSTKRDFGTDESSFSEEVGVAEAAASQCGDRRILRSISRALAQTALKIAASLQADLYVRSHLGRDGLLPPWPQPARFPHRKVVPVDSHFLLLPPLEPCARVHVAEELPVVAVAQQRVVQHWRRCLVHSRPRHHGGRAKHPLVHAVGAAVRVHREEARATGKVAACEEERVEEVRSAVEEREGDEAAHRVRDNLRRRAVRRHDRAQVRLQRLRRLVERAAPVVAKMHAHATGTLEMSTKVLILVEKRQRPELHLLQRTTRDQAVGRLRMDRACCPEGCA
eukprot:4406106-Pleurochrysis_carterae.AAC.4